MVISQPHLFALLMKEWKDCNFTYDKVKKVTKQNHIMACVIAHDVDETCNYAICEDCHRDNMPKRCKADPLSDRRVRCHHEIRNLEQIFDVWWCTDALIGEKDWFNRPQGCVNCEAMFLAA